MEFKLYRAITYAREKKSGRSSCVVEHVSPASCHSPRRPDVSHVIVSDVIRRVD